MHGLRSILGFESISFVGGCIPEFVRLKGKLTLSEESREVCYLIKRKELTAMGFHSRKVYRGKEKSNRNKLQTKLEENIQGEGENKQSTTTNKQMLSMPLFIVR